MTRARKAARSECNASSRRPAKNAGGANGSESMQIQGGDRCVATGTKKTREGTKLDDRSTQAAERAASRARRAGVAAAIAVIATGIAALVGCGATRPIGKDSDVLERSFPADLERRLENPFRGWVAYARPEDARAPAEFDSVSLLIDWATLEPEPGVYDWSPMDAMIARQQRASLSARLYLQPDPYWGLRGRPAWIDRLHPPVFCGDEDPGCARGGVEWSHPPYWDREYRGHAERFLRAFAERYAGRLEYVDARCYGIFGEWDADHHGAFPWSTVAPPGETRRETLEAWVDVYARAFAKSGIRPVINLAAYRSVPDDYLAQVGVLHAMERGFALRYDAFRPNPPVPYVRAAFARYLPGRFLVAEPGYKEIDPASGRRTPCGWCPESAEIVLEQILDAGATYASLGVEPRHWPGFVSSQPALVAKGARWLGYRLSIASLRGPGRVRPGERLHLEMAWRNEGISPLSVPAHAELSLFDRAGGEAWRGRDACSDFDAGRIVRGAPRDAPATEHVFGHCFALPPALEAGRYTLRVALVAEDGQRIALAQPRAEGARRYAVGFLVVDR